VRDGVADALVGVVHNAAGRVVDQPNRQRADQLTGAGLGEHAAAQPGPQQVKFGFGHLALEPEQKPVVERGGS
jgi:hypothetical protein